MENWPRVWVHQCSFSIFPAIIKGLVRFQIWTIEHDSHLQKGFRGQFQFIFKSDSRGLPAWWIVFWCNSMKENLIQWSQNCEVESSFPDPSCFGSQGIFFWQENNICLETAGCLLHMVAWFWLTSKAEKSASLVFWWFGVVVSVVSPHSSCWLHGFPGSPWHVMLGPFSTSIAAASYCLSISQPGDSSCAVKHTCHPVILGERAMGSPGMMYMFLINEELKDPQSPRVLKSTG